MTVPAVRPLMARGVGTAAGACSHCLTLTPFWGWLGGIRGTVCGQRTESV